MRFGLNYSRLLTRSPSFSQCHTNADYESLFIQRENENPESAFFFRLYAERTPVSLGFREEERASLEALEAYDEKGDVFRCLREETNAATYRTRLVMLISALEAIAGQSTTRRGLSTDKDYIRQEIVRDDELFDRLLKYGEGIRNLLLHGSKVELADSEHRDFNYAVLLHARFVRISTGSITRRSTWRL